MDREILFRGKRIDNGEWVKGLPFSFHANNNVEGIETYGGERHRVDSDTVGQFTGLTDKYGERIFEGDICEGKNVLHPSKKIYQVGFDDGLFGLYDDGGTLWHSDHIDDIEVIGNIHDNPELTEGDD